MARYAKQTNKEPVNVIAPSKISVFKRSKRISLKEIFATTTKIMSPSAVKSKSNLLYARGINELRAAGPNYTALRMRNIAPK